MHIFAISKDFGWFSTGPGPEPIMKTFHRSIPIEAIVDWIYEKYSCNPGLIDCLSLSAHGWPGVVSLGQGFGKIGAVKFSPLFAAFAPWGRGIEIHACYAACSSKDPNDDETGTADASGWGYDMMFKLAETTATNVTAPIDYIRGFKCGWSYEGFRTMTVSPTGEASFRDN